MQTTLENQLATCLINYFGDNLISAVLFGSRARGDAQVGSDYDIFLVAKNLPKRILERQSYIRKAVALKFEYRISLYAKTKGEFEKGFPPLYLDLAVDGKILYDRNQYMKKKLRRVKEIIRKAGLYRVKRNGYHSWEWTQQPGVNWAITWDGFYDGNG
ncbi:MAG TPA: nucleotidyltransferase domain-containing protein [bacterium]